jgi:hypothetical protein
MYRLCSLRRARVRLQARQYCHVDVASSDMRTRVQRLPSVRRASITRTEDDKHFTGARDDLFHARWSRYMPSD